MYVCTYIEVCVYNYIYTYELYNEYLWLDVNVHIYIYKPTRKLD